jgi:ABC-type multidrug transport system, ATPase component
MLVFDTVSKSFGKHVVLTNCSFQLPAGSVWALVGPNGAGKTTTLRLAAGLENPSAGQVLVNGHNVQKERHAVQRLIGFCPDVPFAYEFLTGREFLHFVGRLWGLSRTVAEERIAEMLSRLGLDNMADRLVREYSRGMRQKLGFIAAVLHHPCVLLLDEPFTAVDAHSESVMCEWLRGYAQGGRSVLFATHNRELVRKLADKCLRLVNGHMVEEDVNAYTTFQQSAKGGANR